MDSSNTGINSEMDGRKQEQVGLPNTSDQWGFMVICSPHIGYVRSAGDYHPCVCDQHTESEEVAS